MHGDNIGPDGTWWKRKQRRVAIDVSVRSCLPLSFPARIMTKRVFDWRAAGAEACSNLKISKSRTL
jgi:hypothetical protein